MTLRTSDMNSCTHLWRTDHKFNIGNDIMKNDTLWPNGQNVGQSSQILYGCGLDSDGDNLAGRWNCVRSAYKCVGQKKTIWIITRGRVTIGRATKERATHFRNNGSHALLYWYFFFSTVSEQPISKVYFCSTLFPSITFYFIVCRTVPEAVHLFLSALVQVSYGPQQMLATECGEEKSWETCGQCLGALRCMCTTIGWCRRYLAQSMQVIGL